MLEMILEPLFEFAFELIVWLFVASLIEEAREIRDEIQNRKHGVCTMVRLNLR